MDGTPHMYTVIVLSWQIQIWIFIELKKKAKILKSEFSQIFKNSNRQSSRTFFLFFENILLKRRKQNRQDTTLTNIGMFPEQATTPREKRKRKEKKKVRYISNL